MALLEPGRAARAKGIALTGRGGLLPALVGRVLETGLQAELTDHVGYEPRSGGPGVWELAQRQLRQDGEPRRGLHGASADEPEEECEKGGGGG
jgi:hypothetical protein